MDTINRIIFPPGGGGNFVLGQISNRYKFNSITNQYESWGQGIAFEHVWRIFKCDNTNLFIVPKGNALKYVYILALLKKQFDTSRSLRYFENQLKEKDFIHGRMFIDKTISLELNLENLLNKERLNKANNFINLYRDIKISYFSPILLDITFSEYDIDSVDYHYDKLENMIESWEEEYEWSKCDIKELDYYDIFFNLKLDNTIFEGKEDIVKKYTADNINFIKKYDKIFGTKFLEYVP